MLNKTGEAAQLFMNKTGETLQQIKLSLVSIEFWLKYLGRCDVG
jgi:hypothetical protein